MNDDVGSSVLSALVGALDKAGAKTGSSGNVRQTIVLCVPVGEILEELGITNIDFWSLDIEGSDFDVLQTFPWEKIHVEVTPL
jgi:hypothetical protein